MNILLALLVCFAQDDADRQAQRLKAKLKLTDEQAEKIKEIYKGDKETQEKLEKERRDKIRDLLDDDQKKAFDQMTEKGGRMGRGADSEDMKKAIEDAQKQMEEMEKQFGDGGGDGKGFRVMRVGPEAGRKSPEERVKDAMAALKIEDEKEAEVVKGLVKEVVDAQKVLEDHDRDQKKSVDEMAKNKELTDGDIEAKLMELRTKRKERNGAVTEAQKKLSEIVSYRQELELIKRGVLK